jgi:hypothetical protein
VHYQEEHPEHAREFELKQMETTMSAVDRDEHEAVMNTRVPAPTMIHQPMISVAAYGSSSSVC